MPADMKDATWEQFDENALTVIQLCLMDDVLDEFSSEKTSSL
jgi:hypothetical protein